MYFDLEDTPFPAIRFGKNSPEIMALREKEKGDWKELTLEERKRCKFGYEIGSGFPSQNYPRYVFQSYVIQTWAAWHIR